jgi:hypothetical protein
MCVLKGGGGGGNASVLGAYSVEMPPPPPPPRFYLALPLAVTESTQHCEELGPSQDLVLAALQVLVLSPNARSAAAGRRSRFEPAAGAGCHQLIQRILVGGQVGVGLGVQLRERDRGLWAGLGPKLCDASTVPARSPTRKGEGGYI